MLVPAPVPDISKPRAGETLDVTIVGGGMITADLLLPSVLHLQRTGAVREVAICALTRAPLDRLASDSELRAAFPDARFSTLPAKSAGGDVPQPGLFKSVIADMRPRNAVIVAVPDQAHYEVVTEALWRDQHVLCVKPLVQKHEHAMAIAHLGRERGLFVGVEYHKRFDRRALLAKREYAEGQFGEFVMGEARLHEPYYYRQSNFQNWFTREHADPFTYVGCHYVDLVGFITGLRPVAVSVDAVARKFPNGNEGLLWSSARVRYENDALLTVTNGLGYPDDAAGSNDQGLVMYCEGADRTGMIHHDDHERGVRYSYQQPSQGARYRYVSPDFFRLVTRQGNGYQPVGYGFDSVAAHLEAMRRIERESAGLDDAAALAQRRHVLKEFDDAGLLATPANSATNELVIEAARLSLSRNGANVQIVYGDHPHVAAA
jgi:predicted dehydrogenase